MRSLDAQPPPALAQKGLKDTLRHQNYFLACKCYPETDMKVALAQYQGSNISARVAEKALMNREIMRLVLSFETDFNFIAGQFVNLERTDGLTRSYSIANTPNQGKKLEFHIRRLLNGQFSNWVHDELEIGNEITISDAKGSCHYLPGKSDQPLLLVGTGSGLAPLYGILTDALDNGHSGPIHLYHGSREPEGLYLVDEMKAIAESYGNFQYTACVSGNANDDTFIKGRAHDVALTSTNDLKGWRVYLCGHPEMVNQTRKLAYLKGASLSDIYADAFHVQQTAA
jgi:NAD(P)H-flavin reductase